LNIEPLSFLFHKKRPSPANSAASQGAEPAGRIRTVPFSYRLHAFTSADIVNLFRRIKLGMMNLLMRGTEDPFDRRNDMFDRITFDSQIMGGRACIRGMRIPVSVVVGQIAHGAAENDVLKDYPDLEREDIRQALKYAAWLTHEEILAR